MQTKKEEYDEDEESEDEKKGFEIDKPTLILSALFVIISELFFYLLSSKTGSAFGLKEIFFALVVAIVISLFLAWVSFMINLNRYLGTVIGLAGVGAMIYALRTQYQGLYTNIFTILSAVIAIGYIIFYFSKSSKN